MDKREEEKRQKAMEAFFSKLKNSDKEQQEVFDEILKHGKSGRNSRIKIPANTETTTTTETASPVPDKTKPAS